jgi:Zn-dependent protease with chaperone function
MQARPGRRLSATEFEALVHECEEHAKRDRDGYVRRVRALALQGYGYVLLVLVALAATIALLVWLKVQGAMYGVLALVAPLLLLSNLVFHALRLPTQQPEGVRLRPSDAPELFATVERLRTELRAPRLHRILLTESEDAAAQLPRLGLLGWYRNSLLLGLQTMQALSADEFRAVVAHELGHMSRQHGRVTAWIYRIHMTWMQLDALLAARGPWGWRLFEPFVSRWWPRFDAHALALSRQQEYDADLFAARESGNDAFARSLTTTSVVTALMQEKFWPDVFRATADDPKPPQDVLAAQTRAIAAGPAAEDARRWLQAALSERTSVEDTHPSVADRLRAIGIAPESVELRPTPSPTAAERFFGTRLAPLTAELEGAWQKRVAGEWAERQQHRTRARTFLEKLPVDGDVVTTWRRAKIILELDGDEAGLPLLRDLVARAPDHAEANWALAHILADRDDIEAIQHFERAMVGNVMARPAGHHAMATLLERVGRDAEALAHRNSAWDVTDDLSRAVAERQDLGVRDPLLPHGLADDVVARVREALVTVDGLRAAWLVRKKLAHLPESPLYVLGVRSAARLRDGDLVRLGEQVVLPGQVMALVPGLLLRRRIKGIPASQVL